MKMNRLPQSSFPSVLSPCTHISGIFTVTFITQFCPNPGVFLLSKKKDIYISARALVRFHWSCFSKVSSEHVCTCMYISASAKANKQCYLFFLINGKRQTPKNINYLNARPCTINPYTSKTNLSVTLDIFTRLFSIFLFNASIWNKIQNHRWDKMEKAQKSQQYANLCILLETDILKRSHILSVH